MMLPTFKEVKDSLLKDVAASCSSSDQFRGLVNRATEILLNRGDWPGTITPIRVMARRGCVVWPRYVGRVRKINQCVVPMKVGNIWWDFVDKNDYAGFCGNGYYNFDMGTLPNRGIGARYTQQTLAAQGRVPTFDDIPSDAARYIRCYPTKLEDVGKTVRIFGLDSNGQTLRTKFSDGTWGDGLLLTLAVPYASTSVYVSRIDAVQKQVTQGDVAMYAYEPVSDTMLQLAQYEPSETNPSYAKDRIPVATNCNNDPQTVVALVKLAFIPVVVDSDYVLIPSISALESAIQATKYKQAGDSDNYQRYLQLAIDDLNMVLENESPRDTTPVDLGFGGGVQAGFQHVI
jgi:hypothetical protein